MNSRMSMFGLFVICLSLGSCSSNNSGSSGMPLSVRSTDHAFDLSKKSLTLIFDENFDQQADFQNMSANESCIGGIGNGCERMPVGWSDFSVSEKWHPVESGDAYAQAGMQINADNPKGATGKSLMFWDESRGDSGSWGSDAMLGWYFPDGTRDLYVEFWIKFQPGYRWHHLELENPPGTNVAKLLRIGHRDKGLSPFRFSATGSNAPLLFVDSAIWARNNAGFRMNRTTLDLIGRCDPQETNYKCGSYPEVGRGFIDNSTSFENSFGDGKWHKLSARMALNSAPGKEDGIAMVWFDDRLVVAAYNVPYLGHEAPADKLLNMVTFGGYIHNYPEPEQNRFEQWYAIDDVRVYAVEE